MPINQNITKPTSGKLLAVAGDQQRPTEDNMQTGGDFTSSALEGMSVSHTSSRGSGSYAEKGPERRGGGLLQGNSIFQTPEDQCTYEHTETVSAHTGTAQAQPRQGLSMEKGKWAQSPPSDQEATVIGTCWKGRQLVLSME